MAVVNPPKVRHSARALILTDDERLLLCRHVVPIEGVVWAAPGGRIEAGESPLDALCRELREEVGLALESEPPHVWRRDVAAPPYMTGYDRAVSDYFLVRAEWFEAIGEMTEDQLAAEAITGTRWWRLPEIGDYRGTDEFQPRDLLPHVLALPSHGVPESPVLLCS